MDQLREMLPILSGLVAMSVALIKIVELLFSYCMRKLSKKKSESEMIKEVSAFLTDKTTSTLSEEEHYMLRHMYDVLDKTDENGTPLCYDPRDYLQTNREIISVLNKISAYQEKTTVLLEYSIEKLHHLDTEIHNEKNSRR